MSTLQPAGSKKRKFAVSAQYIRQSEVRDVVVPIINNNWISATKTRNYAINDTILDWLEAYGVGRGLFPDNYNNGYDQRLDFSFYIMSQGVHFEGMIMRDLMDRNKLSSNHTINYEHSHSQKIQETLRLMKEGVTIISQGMVFNPENKTFGLPDLLVRSDVLNKLVSEKVISEFSETRGCALSKNWHYRVVDVKFSTLKLKANATTLLNVGSQKAYKLQVQIYNEALAHMQGYNPKKAYILGRGWEVKKMGTIYTCNDPFSKLGVVDFLKDDSDIEDAVSNALSWIRRLRTDGAKWDILPRPTVPELYPNMSNEMDGKWKGTKQRIAEDIKEITLLWQCGTTARKAAHLHQVFSWEDPRCSAINLGITGQETAATLDKILDINRGTGTVLPKLIKNRLFDWPHTSRFEFFIDFENVTSVRTLDDNSTSMIYMIGIGIVVAGEWHYRSFTVDSLEEKEEIRIVKEFLGYLDSFVNTRTTCPNCFARADSAEEDKKCTFQFCPSKGVRQDRTELSSNKPIVKPIVKLWHYSHAESDLLEKALEKIENMEDNLEAIKESLVLCDLLKVIKEEPVVINGALNFSLKSIVKALNNQGKIKVSYGNCKITCGTDGLMAAISAEKETPLKISTHPLIKEAISYNEIDCKSVHEILTYLRNNHVSRSPGK